VYQLISTDLRLFFSLLLYINIWKLRKEKNWNCKVAPSRCVGFTRTDFWFL